jgi:hypothetical protein
LTALEQALAGTRVFDLGGRIRPSAESAWTGTYVRRLILTDAAAITASVAIAQIVRFGADPAPFGSEVPANSYTAVSALLILAWFSALILFRSREPRVLGTGVEEYRRVANASAALFGTVAVISYLLKLEVARGYLAVALPLGIASLLLTRRLWRKWLVRQRAERRFVCPLSSWSVRTALPPPWPKSSNGCRARAIEWLEYVFLVGAPERAVR